MLLAAATTGGRGGRILRNAFPGGCGQCHSGNHQVENAWRFHIRKFLQSMAKDMLNEPVAPGSCTWPLDCSSK